MADELKKSEGEVAQPVPPQVRAPEKEDKVTENPGEGNFMFSDWALI